ncbi:MAG TPA: CBS domain-containing protein [Gemmatimonadetes bacterium]|nr:CBS domain-containing protein [Gemmatimonadota bacterium]
MKVAEMLRDGAILVPLDAPDLQWALTNTLRAVPAVSDESAMKIAEDLLEGVSGEIHRVHPRVAVALVESEAVGDICAAIGVAPTGFSGDEAEPDTGVSISGEGSTGASESGAEALLILVTSGRFVSMRDRMLPTLKRFFREEERVAPLLNAGSADAVRRVSGLMDLELHQSLLVEDVVEPVQYRVYPDTPYSEVTDLMIRRDLDALPVVGKNYEFLGIITTGDAMKEVLLQARVEERVGGGSSASPKEPTAREIMTRSVMCISEEQSLMEAASIMVNRDVEQLPVIREGEMVGFLTRGEVLRRIFPTTSLNQEERT